MDEFQENVRTLDPANSYSNLENQQDLKEQEEDENPNENKKEATAPQNTNLLEESTINLNLEKRLYIDEIKGKLQVRTIQLAKV